MATKASDSLSLIGSLVPAGVIMPFGGATAPSGWLLCEGAAISRTTYAALYAAIGVAWGYGDNSTTFNLPDLRGRFLRGRANGSAKDPDRAIRAICNTGGNTGDNVGSVQGMASARVSDTQIINGQATKATTGLTATSTQVSLGATTRSLTSGSAAADTSSRHIHSVRAADSGSTVSGQGISFSAGGATFVTFTGTQILKAVTNSDGFDSAHSHGVTGSTDIGHDHGTPTITVGTGDNETRPINANVNYIIKI